MSVNAYTVRGFRSADAVDLVDMDLKCCDMPWTSEEWSKRQYSADFGISLAMFYGTPVGFVVFQPGVEILKLAVKEQHRRKGLSRELLEPVLDYARKNKVTSVSLIVPESTVTVSGPGNLTAWLTKLRFKPEIPFLKDHFSQFGETEDGIRFKLAVPDET